MSEIETTLTCAFHPNRETSLRCNRCSKPICIKCATHTPTGYRCPECIRSQQKVFVTTRWYDHIIAGAISGVISFVGSLFASALGFYAIFIALGAGYLAVVAAKKAISNRRSPLLKFVMSASAFLAALIPLISLVVTFYRFGYWSGYDLIWRLGYAVITAGNVYYQLRN